MIGRANLTWRGDTLHLGDTPLLRVVPDRTYDGMWRVQHRGGLSDMSNLTWAKDAAVSMALSELNQRVGETATGAPLIH